jgi:hypothetical protein
MDQGTYTGSRNNSKSPPFKRAIKQLHPYAFHQKTRLNEASSIQTSSPEEAQEGRVFYDRGTIQGISWQQEGSITGPSLQCIYATLDGRSPIDAWLRIQEEVTTIPMPLSSPIPFLFETVYLVSCSRSMVWVTKREGYRMVDQIKKSRVA